MSSQTKGEWRKYVALIQQKFATFLLPNKCLPRRLHTNITKYRLNMFPEIPDFFFFLNTSIFFLNISKMF